MAATNHGNPAIPSLPKNPGLGKHLPWIPAIYGVPFRDMYHSVAQSVTSIDFPAGRPRPREIFLFLICSPQTVPRRAARRTSDRPSGIDMGVSLSLSIRQSRICGHCVVQRYQKAYLPDSQSNTVVVPRVPYSISLFDFQFGEEEGRSLLESE